MTQSLYESIVLELNEDRLKKSLKSMLAIKSENPFDGAPREGFREKEMAEYYREMMSQLGLETELVNVAPGRPNVYGVLKGTGEKGSLMLAGHMDTMPTDGYPEAYDIEECNNKIYGRGACDMKAALAAYLEVVRILKEADCTLKGDLILAGICDEEYKMLGSKHVGNNGPVAQHGIIGEPSNLEICPANRGQLGSTIRVYGKSVHSSVQHEGVNAIVHMAKVINAFDGYNEELKEATPHPLLGHACFNPGVIRGGSMLSTVPDYCELEVDRRFLPDESVEQIYQEYYQRIEPLKKELKDFSFEISSPTWEIRANDVSTEDPVVSALVAACGKITDNPVIKSFVAGSDAPYLGFPTVICGPGSLSQAHSNDEFVSVDQLIAAVKIYLSSVCSLLA